MSDRHLDDAINTLCLIKGYLKGKETIGPWHDGDKQIQKIVNDTLEHILNPVKQ